MPIILVTFETKFKGPESASAAGAKLHFPRAATIADNMLDLEDFLPYRLSLLSNRISHGISRTYQDRHDLNVTEWRVLAVLGRYPGISASEVVGRTAMDKVAISRAARLLLDKGLIERHEDRADRRCKKLYLSPAGRDLHERIAPAALAYEESLVSVLSADERRVLDRALQKLIEAAEDGLDGAHPPLPPRS